jgi:uncharacterized protein
MVRFDRKAAREKEGDLIRRLEGLDTLLIAFSGGVDSTYLLAVAHHVLGKGVLAATALSAVHPNKESAEARAFLEERDIPHVLFHSGEMELPSFVANTKDRCYHCKRHMLKTLFKIAGERGILHVAHGANLDDLKDYRPGFRAALEMGVFAPLVDARLRKEELRFLAAERGLSVWDKPAMACMATRIPYGVPITRERLHMIEEAESFLRDRGFGAARVRHHGSVARIEVPPSELERLTSQDMRQSVVDGFRSIGFLHIALDLEGYVSGKMNRELSKESPADGTAGSRPRERDGNGQGRE